MTSANPANAHQLAAEMLRHMTWHGEPPIGARLLAQHPDLATHDLFTAVATGNLAAVQQHLARDPVAATRPGGPLNWEPLLYLAYSRLPGHDQQAVEIAQALLAHGANANARWVDPWDNPFTLITGVIAQGEGVKPPHPQANELVALFLQHGAVACDTQSLYNTSIVADDPHWLDVLWNASTAQGIADRWRAAPMHQLNFLLGNAVANGHRQRAAWLLAHGADANCAHSYSGRPLLQLTLLHGMDELTDLLRQHGATDQPLSPTMAFQVACMQGDFDRARDLATGMPMLLQHAEPLKVAASLGRTDVIRFLLSLGIPVDVMDAAGGRALQSAVAADAREAVRLLLEQGSEVDTPSKHYGGAMGTAAHFGRRECAGILAPLSRDVHAMTRLGMQQRLAEIFRQEPALVNRIHSRLGHAPLFMLPDDDVAALDMVRFLLTQGANPQARNKEGRTAGELARLRGQDTLATLLGA